MMVSKQIYTKLSLGQSNLSVHPWNLSHFLNQKAVEKANYKKQIAVWPESLFLKHTGPPRNCHCHRVWSPRCEMYMAGKQGVLASPCPGTVPAAGRRQWTGWQLPGQKEVNKTLGQLDRLSMWVHLQNGLNCDTTARKQSPTHDEVDRRPVVLYQVFQNLPEIDQKPMSVSERRKWHHKSHSMYTVDVCLCMHVHVCVCV